MHLSILHFFGSTNAPAAMGGLIGHSRSTPRLFRIALILAAFWCAAMGIPQAAAQTHPFLIVKESEYTALRALCTGANSRAPFIGMRQTAGWVSDGSFIDESSDIRSRAQNLTKIMDATTLSYILDTNTTNRTKYRKKFYDNLKYWDLAQTGNITKDLNKDSWDNCIPTGAAFFATVIAMDVFYNDPNTTAAQIAQRDGFNAMMEKTGGAGNMGPATFFNTTVFDHHLTAHAAARGIWALWKGGLLNNTALDAAVALYKTTWLDFITDDGCYREYSGYAMARAGDPGRYHKSAFNDVIVFSGIDPNWYAHPKMQKFYEWLAGYSQMPNRYGWPIGDSSYAPFQSTYASPFDRAYAFSPLAARYGEWQMNGATPAARLFSYLTRARAPSTYTALQPTSRIFADGGAYLIQKNAGTGALASVLTNLKHAPSPTGGFGHIHKAGNSLNIAGFGEVLMRGPGYNGWGGDAGDANNFGFNFSYVNAHAVSENVALFNYNIGDYKNPSFTNDHRARIGGQGVRGMLSAGLDYATGDTGPLSDANRIISNGRHIRHTVSIYPQDGVNGYVFSMDELEGASTATNGHLVWHPYSDTITFNADNASNDRYEWQIRQYVNTTDQLFFSIFMPTAPNGKQQYDGLFADDIQGTSIESFVGRYIFNTYALNSTTKKKNVLTMFFPRKSTQNNPAMARITATGSATSQAAAFSFAGGVTDFVFESDGTSERTVTSPTSDPAGALMRGKVAVYRKITTGADTDLAFYFIGKGRSFKNTATDFNRGFVSVADVDLHMDGNQGTIVSPGTNVTFYNPGFHNVKLNGTIATPLQQTNAYTQINVPAGTHAVTLESNAAPTIAAIAAQTINEDGTTGAIPFVVGDTETLAANLTVTRATSNTTLVPLANVVLGGTGANRTVTVTPAANLSGTATITLTVTDGEGATSTSAFLLTVNAVNDLPTISTIAAQTVNEDTATGALAVTVGDIETAAASLTLTRASSNLTLVPLANVVLGGTGANRTVTVTPAANQSGTATITLTVTDGNAGTATSAFLVTVNAVNDLPTISAIAAQTINEDTPTGALAVTIGDVETAASSLTLTRASSNLTLVPLANIVLGGTAANRTVTVTPAANQSGTATITLTVTDGNDATATSAFLVTVNAVNDLPTISAVAAQTIDEDTAAGALAVTVGDIETAAASLTLTRASSNLTLVPLANVVLGGTGANRTVTVTPAANQSGTATITLTVTDGNAGTATSAFLVTVNAVNDLPTISAVAPQTIDEDTPTGALAVTVSDLETAAASLTLTRASSNLTLVPLANVVLGGTAANRTVTVTPAANQSGTATITLTVTDGSGATATSAFLVTVNAVNDLPTISTVAAQTIDEDTTTGALAVTVSDLETAAASLTLTRASSNLTLVPLANVVLGGTAANRTVTVTPAANQSGTATITLTVTDGSGATATSAFLVTVNAVNDLPAISAVAPQTIDEDTPTGALAVTVGDLETAAASLTLTRASSNLTLLPLANVVLGGTAANRTVTVTPTANQSGTATITLTVTDGSGATATSAFLVTVNAVNDLPTISTVAAQTIDEDTATGALAVTVSDLETAAPSLMLTRASSNLTLVPLANVVLGGTAANRTVTVTPAANQSGTATITLTVTDGGGATATSAFLVTVNAVNDLPTISTVPTQTVDENGATGEIAFEVGDIETPPTALLVAAESSDPVLIPASGIVVAGTAGSRTIQVTPAAYKSGSAIVTLTVTDDQGASTLTTFTVNVTPAPITNVTAYFRDGNGTATSQQVPGIAGSGWLGGWGQSAAVLPTAASAVPLRDGADYLHVARTGGTSGQEGVFRQWSNVVRPTNQFTQLTFDIRLDSPLSVFNSAADNISITTRSGAGASTGNDSSMFIRVHGGQAGALRAREWGVFNGDPGVVNNFDTTRFLPTGMICEPGVTYRFTIDIYAASGPGNTNGRIHGTYDVTIFDGTNTVRLNGAGFRTASYQSGGYVALSTQQSLATDNLSFSVDTIVLDELQPEPLPAMARWRSAWVPPPVLADPALEDSHWGDLADYDADGSSNLLEYAVGSNPAEGTSAWLPVAGADPSGRLTLSFPRVADPNLLYEVLGSSNLGGWTTIWSSTGAANVAGTVLVTDTAPLGQSSRFLRLRVTTP